jgi:heptosyltransferase-2/heptosyltransferase-3
LLGWTGVPVTDRPRTSLGISPSAAEKVDRLINEAGLSNQNIALIHPAAAFATKQWAVEKFARVVEFSSGARIHVSRHCRSKRTAVCSSNLRSETSAKVVTLALSLPEVTALAARSQLFVGNDSGIAHIAAAVGTPAVVVFGSSNIAHWRPWNSGPAEVVFEEMPCQPCHGYFCEQFAQPECILRVPVVRVTAAIRTFIVVNVSTNQNACFRNTASFARSQRACARRCDARRICLGRRDAHFT